MNRQKLLEAAGRVYAEGGFRGATTRRIAEEAGVNEVTLFRLFGSKAQLIAEAMQCMDPMGAVSLPETPADPQRELTDWCNGHLGAMRQWRSVIRKSLADLDEHPEMLPFVCDGQTAHFQMLADYATKVAPPATDADREHLTVACSMLFSALFSDAMGRDVVPTAYPSPEEAAADRYVRVFLRALGVAAQHPSPHPSPQPTPDDRPDAASGN
jgi:AcrR family transcriptional regulator